jgi:hypothetical protein
MEWRQQMNDPDQVVDLKAKEAPEATKPTRARLGFLLVGSAVFGGIAVALWNRRTLAKMQNRAAERTENIQPLEDDAIY